MLFNLRLYYETVFSFINWAVDPFRLAVVHQFALNSFSLTVRFFRIENLQESKLFNAFYLAKYFFGYPAQLFFLKKYFVLGRTYYNMEVGLHLHGSAIFQPLSIWVFQLQPLVNLALTRDYFINNKQLQWILRDSSIFSERKTNAGLFDLAEPVIFFLNYRDPVVSSVFLKKKMLSSLKLLL